MLNAAAGPIRVGGARRNRIRGYAGGLVALATAVVLVGGSAPAAAAPPHADLVLTMTHWPSQVHQGDAFYYRIDVVNRGTTKATGVEVTDALPPQVSLQFASDSCRVEEEVICGLPDLRPGDEATVVINVKALETGTVSNTATVRSARPDSVPGDESDTLVINVEPERLAKVNLYFGARSGVLRYETAYWVSQTDRTCAVHVPLFSDGVALLDAALAGGCIDSYDLDTSAGFPALRCIDDLCDDLDAATAPVVQTTWYLNHRDSNYRDLSRYQALGGEYEYVRFALWAQG